MKLAFLSLVSLLAADTLAREHLHHAGRFLYNGTPHAPHAAPLALLAKTSEPTYFGDNVAVPFSQSLGCGACVTGGYIYCYKGVEGQIQKELSRSNSRCCKTETDCKGPIQSNAWTCTNLFTDPTLAKFACPFVNTSCGPNNTYEFTEAGASLSINITLEPGQTCFYDIKTKCGAPVFRLNDTTGLDIEYIDYDDKLDIPQAEVIVVNETSTVDKTTLKTKTPKKGMPSRDMKFKKDNGSETVKGPRAGRYNPHSADGTKPRKFKGGQKDYDNETECSHGYRHTLLVVTSLENLTLPANVTNETATNSTPTPSPVTPLLRLLETTSTISTADVTLTVGSEGYTTTSGKIIAMTVAVFALLLTYFTF